MKICFTNYFLEKKNDEMIKSENDALKYFILFLTKPLR